MSAQRQPDYEFTEKEYRQRAEDSGIKLEFWDGQIYAMAGATPDHNDIAINVSSSLHTQLRGKSCLPRASDQRVKAGTLQTYPDVVVACRPLQYDPNDRNTLIDAVVIVDVLSRSTQSKDRNLKFDRYNPTCYLCPIYSRNQDFEDKHAILGQNFAKSSLKTRLWREHNPIFGEF